MDNLHLNEACIKNKTKCFSFFLNAAKLAKQSPTKEKKYTGHPASIFCSKAKGSSQIYYDQENNEHDYCEFVNSFTIDSWDFYRSFKQ